MHGFGSAAAMRFTRMTLCIPSAIAVIAACSAHRDWSDFAEPLPGPPRIVGQHAAGCLIGAEQLSPEGVGYQAVELERNRHYGHPDLVDYVQALGRRVDRAGFGSMLVGDMAQPRGGPMPYGHASHQSGLDVDIWFRLDLRPLKRSERKGIEHPILVDAETGELDRTRWSDQQAELVRLAAQDPRVTRIFVDGAIKRDLCERQWQDRSWLQRIRPWPFHDDHFHVRLRCPADSPDCVDQSPPPPGEGCDGILPTPRTATTASPPRPLPTACEAVFER